MGDEINWTESNELPVLDSDGAAHLIVSACSEPPEGRHRWTASGRGIFAPSHDAAVRLRNSSQSPPDQHAKLTLVYEPLGARLADLDCAGEVGPEDLAIVLGDWGPCLEPCSPDDPADTCPPDFDGDCLVGPWDLRMCLGIVGHVE